MSRASADQRAGRCGRLGPGICIRLFSEDDFARRQEFTEPEVLRTNLASVILQMAALDLGDIESFPFLDPPDRRAIRDGVALLEELNAVDSDNEATSRWLTPVGRNLSRFPLDPRIGRMVIEADRNASLREVLVIASALTIQDPRVRPVDKETQADQLHARFRDPSSDFLSWLHLWDYVKGERRERTSNQFRRMCRDEYLDYRRVREWQDLHTQLREITEDLGFHSNHKPADPEMIHRALLTGLLSHVGKKDPNSHEYRGARGARFSIAPGSTLFKANPEWVMAADLVETTRLWARGMAQVPVEWIEHLGAHLLIRSYSDPWWDAERGSAVARETVTLYGIPLAAERVVQIGKTDPEAARELFIRHALIAGEWDTHHEFVARNSDRIAEVLEMEARERRSDLLADDDDVFAVFDGKVPADVVSVRDFDRWWKDVRSETPHLLDLTLDDLIDSAADGIDPEAFPDVWRHGDLAMPLEYEFDPASPTDGTTIDIPLSGLERVDPSVFDWHVPGRRAEVIEAMIRSLPKALRKQFVPIAETVAVVVERIDPGRGSLAMALRRELERISGAAIPPDTFDPDGLPRHLRPRFRVVDDDGDLLAEGDDLAALREHLAEAARATVATAGHEIERTGLTAWDFGELPPSVEIGEPGHRATVYPALIDERDSVAIRLLATPGERDLEMRAGVRRLILLALPSPDRLLRPLLTESAKRAIRTGPYETVTEWVDDCLMASIGA
ncbi:ATP-dependent RNA helicase HrpA, partial [bacterium]|nr:ATP-dependent RNA helicase HrpA [bacterium]